MVQIHSPQPVKRKNVPMWCVFCFISVAGFEPLNQDGSTAENRRTCTPVCAPRKIFKVAKSNPHQDLQNCPSGQFFVRFPIPVKSSKVKIKKSGENSPLLNLLVLFTQFCALFITNFICRIISNRTCCCAFFIFYRFFNFIYCYCITGFK